MCANAFFWGEFFFFFLSIHHSFLTYLLSAKDLDQEKQTSIQ